MQTSTETQPEQVATSSNTTIIASQSVVKQETATTSDTEKNVKEEDKLKSRSTRVINTIYYEA